MLRKKAFTPILVFTLAAALAEAPLAGTERVRLQVAFEDVPGARELDAGDLERGISITEAELERRNSAYRSELLANLCGAYVLTREIDEARRTCNEAVEAGSRPSAFNNRGVLRVLIGDLEGARQDFETVRPDDVEKYVDELKRMDPRFMASENLSRLDRAEKRVALAGDDNPLPLDIPVEEL